MASASPAARRRSDTSGSTARRRPRTCTRESFRRSAGRSRRCAGGRAAPHASRRAARRAARRGAPRSRRAAPRASRCTAARPRRPTASRRARRVRAAPRAGSRPSTRFRCRRARVWSCSSALICFRRPARMPANSRLAEVRRRRVRTELRHGRHIQRRPHDVDRERLPLPGIRQIETRLRPREPHARHQRRVARPLQVFGRGVVPQHPAVVPEMHDGMQDAVIRRLDGDVEHLRDARDTA